MADQVDADELTEVFASIDSTQVQMAHDLLDGSGIRTFIFDDDSSRMLGSTGAVPSRLMVNAADAEEARSRLKELGFVE
jgi:Putative prokaryotic signal transducing protein